MDIAERNRMVEQYSGVIDWTIRRWFKNYIRCHADYEDMRSVGMLSLLKAVDKYDGSTKITYFLSFCIRRAIKQHVDQLTVYRTRFRNMVRDQNVEERYSNTDVDLTELRDQMACILPRLTGRHREVIKLLLEGKSQKETKALVKCHQRIIEQALHMVRLHTLRYAS